MEKRPYDNVLVELQMTWDDMGYEQKEAAAAIVFQAIIEAIKTDCSFRGLIYDIMDFGPVSYAPLYLSGGMDITNFIGEALSDREEVKQLRKALWPFASMHRPGCDLKETAFQRGMWSQAQFLSSKDFYNAALALGMRADDRDGFYDDLNALEDEMMEG